MNKTVLKICSIVMVLSLLMLTFTACGEREEFDKKEGESLTNTENVTTANGNGGIVEYGTANPLTGEPISEDAKNKRPVAIMVENTPDARPQWGLSTPDIVFEGLVEGGITRMMWVYADVNDVPKVGPVRSARHDYVEIAAGMNAIYAHWGGSPQAYDKIKELGMKDIDGNKYGTNSNYSASSASTFFKDNTRSNVSTEHRGFTTGALLAKRISSLGINTTAKDGSWTPFNVISEGVRYAYGEDSGICNTISVTFSASYKHEFRYNAEDKLYYNYMNGSPMMDGSTNTQMAVTNVIVMYCNVQKIAGDDKGRQDWDLTSGDAVFVSHGYGEAIRWEKKSADSPLEFFSKKSGEKLVVNKGQTWIGVVPEANRGLTSVEG